LRLNAARLFQRGNLRITVHLQSFRRCRVVSMAVDDHKGLLVGWVWWVEHGCLLTDLAYPTRLTSLTYPTSLTRVHDPVDSIEQRHRRQAALRARFGFPAFADRARELEVLAIECRRAVERRLFPFTVGHRDAVHPVGFVLTHLAVVTADWPRAVL